MTIDLADLVTVIGGNLASSSSRPDSRPWNIPAPKLPLPKPSPTIPLGPFVPSDPRRPIV